MNATVSQWQAGQRVEWHHEDRHGYCPAWWVPAVVVRVGTKRVTIDAYRTGGGTKRVSVQPERLRARQYTFGSET